METRLEIVNDRDGVRVIQVPTRSGCGVTFAVFWVGYLSFAVWSASPLFLSPSMPLLFRLFWSGVIALYMSIGVVWFVREMAWTEELVLGRGGIVIHRGVRLWRTRRSLERTTAEQLIAERGTPSLLAHQNDPDGLTGAGNLSVWVASGPQRELVFTGMLGRDVRKLFVEMKRLGVDSVRRDFRGNEDRSWSIPASDHSSGSTRP